MHTFRYVLSHHQGHPNIPGLITSHWPCDIHSALFLMGQNKVGCSLKIMYAHLKSRTLTWSDVRALELMHAQLTWYTILKKLRKIPLRRYESSSYLSSWTRWSNGHDDDFDKTHAKQMKNMRLEKWKNFRNGDEGFLILMMSSVQSL